MDYGILTYGNQALRRKARPVATVDETIRQLAEDMLDAMHKANGLGLAAEQIGREEAICVIDIPPEAQTQGAGGTPLSIVPMPLVLVNPRITASEGEQVGQEGCLSFPDLYINVKRAAVVTVEFVDAENRSQSVRAAGLLARAVQHELDHLNGVLLVDHMTSVQKMAAAAKLKRMKKAAQCAA